MSFHFFVAELFAEIRFKEMKVYTKFLLAQCLSTALPQAVPVFSSAITFLAMTSTGSDLNATQVSIWFN